MSVEAREKLFGTDGVRGIPGRYPLTPDLVRDLAETAARILLARSGRRVNGTAPFVLMARDTRGSGPALCRQLVAGFARAGCRTVDLGVVPTPALSALAPRHGALAGVMVSASHNPAEFNGIKFVTADGFKMDEATESAVEKALWSSTEEGRELPRSTRPISAKVEDGSGLVQDYLEFLKSTFPATLDLSNLRLVIDCAHGAASKIAPGLFRSLGAEVFPIACAPNGRNINKDCGALFPEAMQKEVLRRKAHAGVSFDGDADRALFADEKGRLLDGDALICLSARRLDRLGLLKGRTVVLTVMSNFGLLKYLREQGIGVVTVPVGDKNVTEAIEKGALSLGGEASGHVIFRRFSPTGDGLLTALQTLAALRESGKPLSAHRDSFKAVPQILLNVRVARRVPLEGLPGLRREVRRVEKQLAGDGRILLRYSGTEPLLRIMVEGPGKAGVAAMAHALARAFKREAGEAISGGQR